ncbi:MAG: type II toxin-antitoxin system VapC family toxin [Cyanobacteriota bacterium]|jgi:PIN domain nuclease of toxin-antitoxin system|nr:type II toxin-antitoxin system VapC family toxin [Cyanobacteriota bacterium]
MASEGEGLLVDTHLLLWWAAMPEQLPEAARSQLESTDQPLVFSVASLWEVAIKASLAREGFQVDPTALRLGLLQESFRELPIQADHVLAVRHLPWIHRDPFDRLLVAQAQREDLRLLTTDRSLLGYGEMVQFAG